MKTLEKFENGQELTLNYVSTRFSGYGHQTITVELEYKGEIKEFSRTTDNMPAFDEATDLEGEEKQIALYEIIESKIEDLVNEWISEIDYEE